jgi:hypothetical protein
MYAMVMIRHNIALSGLHENYFLFLPQDSASLHPGLWVLHVQTGHPENSREATLYPQPKVQRSETLG